MPLHPPPAEPPYAYVVEYRPLDRCFPPACRIRSRDIEGYATDTQSDGDPGAYVKQGEDGTIELTVERGVVLRPAGSFELELPPADHDSELDLRVAAISPNTPFEANVVVTDAASKQPLLEQRVAGTTLAVKKGFAGRASRLSQHVRIPLPSRRGRVLKVTIANPTVRRIAIGSPLVMKRVAREPRQALFALFDAVPFHLMRALFSGNVGDPRADWISEAVKDRGVYFPWGQSMGQGTAYFVIRFFTGGYFEGQGWPGMWGDNLDPTPSELAGGPLARAAELGFITHWVGHNAFLLPNQAYLAFDSGNQSENEHPDALMRGTEEWVAEHPHDDAVVVWWDTATHFPYGGGVKTVPPPEMPLPRVDQNVAVNKAVWPNLVEGASLLADTYQLLRRAAPNASRVVWVSADHSGASSKMTARAFRCPGPISTNIAHACAATAEEGNTPFGIFFDGAGEVPSMHLATERTSSTAGWAALEQHFGVDLELPKTTSFGSPVLFGQAHAATPIWDDRVVVSIGGAGATRATRGDLAYAWFEHKLNHQAVWGLKGNEQLVLVGAPTRSEGLLDEELYDDNADPYEYDNIAGKRLETTLAMRHELADWMAAHHDPTGQPRHAYHLTFERETNLDLLAPHPVKVLADGVLVASSDPRLAHVRAKELVVVEGDEPASIVELSGLTGPRVLKCSANGLPLDFVGEGRARLNLAVARTNCPLAPTAHDRPAAGEILFSFEPASNIAGAAPAKGPASAPTTIAPNAELYSGMKRWGYVRDVEEKK